MIFTRYLYIKDEVQIALATSILQKSEESVFWAYELYYSGFKEETFELLWRIYYYFFASLNPSFETYFMKKHKEWTTRTSGELDYYVSLIVNNLLSRSYNIDVFMLEKINLYLETEDDENEEPRTITNLIETKNYSELMKRLLTENNDQTNKAILDEASKYFGKKITTTAQKYTPVKICAKILGFAHQQISGKKEKNFYATVKPEDVVMYETISLKTVRPYKILQIACLFSIDKYNYLSLFDTDRDKEPRYIHMYHVNWLYGASYSPIWAERISVYGGTPNHTVKRVCFQTEDSEEAFYESFGYEPDEQKIEVQHKSIQNIKSVRTWKTFVQEHNENGIVVFDEDFLDALDKVLL